MAQMVSAALFIILLFLPVKSCLPLEWPMPAMGHLLPASGLSWEQRMRHSAWGNKSSLPAGASEEEGLFQDQRNAKPCKLPGENFTPQEQKPKRSTASSKRRDGRPNSLDLTFHLLREFLEMSREERLAQRARSNKILLHNIGK